MLSLPRVRVSEAFMWERRQVIQTVIEGPLKADFIGYKQFQVFGDEAIREKQVCG